MKCYLLFLCDVSPSGYVILDVRSTYKGGDGCEYDMVEDGDSHWIITYTIPDYREGMCKFSWGKSEDKILDNPILIKVK